MTNLEKRMKDNQKIIDQEEKEYKRKLKEAYGMEKELIERPYDGSSVQAIQERINKLNEIIEIYADAKLNAVDIDEEHYKVLLEELRYVKFKKDHLETQGATFINPKKQEMKEIKPVREERVGDQR